MKAQSLTIVAQSLKLGKMAEVEGADRRTWNSAAIKTHHEAMVDLLRGRRWHLVVRHGAMVRHWRSRTFRRRPLRYPPQAVHRMKPALELVPTRENAGQLLSLTLKLSIVPSPRH